jgi:hypothetical protein
MMRVSGVAVEQHRSVIVVPAGVLCDEYAEVSAEVELQSSSIVEA